MLVDRLHAWAPQEGAEPAARRVRVSCTAAREAQVTSGGVNEKID